MESQENRTSLELHEPGFDGDLVIEVRDGSRRVRLVGTRPQDGTAVEKDLPSDRDPQLDELADSVVAGDDGAAVRLLAHVGVLDPS
jgi:hypothetical protein